MYRTARADMPKSGEYDLRDSLYRPEVDCSDLTKVKISQTFEDVEFLTGHIPVKNDYYPYPVHQIDSTYFCSES